MKSTLSWVSLASGIGSILIAVYMPLAHLTSWETPYVWWEPIVAALIGLAFLVASLVLAIMNAVELWSRLPTKERKDAIREAAWWIRFAYALYHLRT